MSAASEPPADRAPIDQTTLLMSAKLRLAPELLVVQVRPDRLMVKYLPGRRYLVATAPQWKALVTFAEGRTVPDVLTQLISERRSPPLREFYELVLKACRHGILQADGLPLPEPDPPVQWRARARGRAARWLALLAMAAAIVTLLIRPLEMPENAGQLVLGWLLTCAATSAGYALAACLVRGADAEIYAPTFAWRTLAPHFRADLEDVAMGGREAEIDTALMRLAPQFVFAAVAALHSPGLLFPLLCGVLYHISPLWPSPMLSLLRALYRDPQLTTTYDFLFAQNRLFSVLLRSRLRFADRKFLLVCAGYTLVWLFLVCLAGGALLHVNAFTLVHRFQAARGLHFTALTLLVTFGAMVLSTAGVLGWIGFRHLRGWLRDRAERRRRPDPAEISPATISAQLAGTFLFSRLPPAELAALVAVIRPESHPAGATVIREGDPGDRLYVVFSGRVEVVQELTVGRPEPVAVLQPGDVFGEISLLHGVPRTRTVRCATPAVLLALTKEDFTSLVLSRLSREFIADAVQKVGFLHRIPLARTWSPYALASFAERSSFQNFKADEIVVRDGSDNSFFYLIYEGELAVLKGEREVARLGPGEFFGEISLLQNSVATAGIVARRPSRCLAIVKREFLQFMAHDFLIGLQFEDITTKRLGRALFPLKGKSIEEGYN